MYYIKIRGVEQVTFYFRSFDSEFAKDVLEYGTGDAVGTGNFNYIGGFEGDLNDNLPEPITLPTNETVYFQWFTDRNIQRQGFELVYTTGKMYLMLI